MDVRISACALLFLAGIVRAEQGCAPGFYPGGSQPGGAICVPIPGYGTTNSTSASGGPVWASRWGAVAIGETKEGWSVAGSAEGVTSRGKAKRTALEDCKSQGGNACAVFVAYTNQCVALATGPGHTTYGRAASVGEAEAIAVSECQSASSGACAVFYRACSLPEQIR